MAYPSGSPIAGLDTLRRGIFYIFISALLSIIADFLFITIIGGIIMAIIALVFYFLAFGKIKDGFTQLAMTGLDVGSGKTGATLYLVGIILELVGLGLSLILIGLFLLPVAAILELIGDILIGLGIYRVGSYYNNSLTKIGGILIMTLIIDFIGYILAYVGLGEIIRSGGVPIQQYPQPYYQQPYPQQPYQPYPQPYQQQPTMPSQAPSQVGQGIIRNNGYAQVTLYSPTQASITSAFLIAGGSQIPAISITPSSLFAGNNEVTFYFGNNIPPLQSGQNYQIVINLNTQSGTVTQIVANVTYQP